MRTVLRSLMVVSLAGVIMLAPALAEEALPALETVAIGENREFLVNGEPFFPIMSWLQSVKQYKMLRGLGINTFCGNHGMSAEVHCKAAGEAGGYAVSGIRTDSDGGIGSPWLLAWIHGDEPDMTKKQDDGSFKPRTDPGEVAAQYQQIKTVDNSRPVFVTFCATFMRESTGKYTDTQKQALYPAFVKGADVVGFDTYPIYGSGYPAHVNWPAYGTAQLREIAGPKRPVYAWIETSKGSKWMTYEKQPDVLPKHTRFEVWGVVIEGATAIGYFTHAWKPSFKEFAPTPEMQEELKRLNAQVTRLAPDILAPVSKRHIEMTIQGGLQCHFKATERDGVLTIFAQNQDIGIDEKTARQFQPIAPRAGEATFTMPGLTAGTTIDVVDENRSLTAAGGRFVDDFGPLGEHIYRLKF